MSQVVPDGHCVLVSHAVGWQKPRLLQYLPPPQLVAAVHEGPQTPRAVSHLVMPVQSAFDTHD